MPLVHWGQRVTWDLETRSQRPAKTDRLACCSSVQEDKRFRRMSAEMSLLGLSLAEHDLVLLFYSETLSLHTVLVCLKLLGSSNPPASALKCWNHRYASCSLAKECLLVLTSKIFYCELTTGSFDSTQATSSYVLSANHICIVLTNKQYHPEPFKTRDLFLCWRCLHQDSWGSCSWCL